MVRNLKLITYEHGVAVSPIASCGGGSKRLSQCCARALQVKVLKGLRRVIVREQRCAREGENSPGRQCCTL